jgi:POT family proton-dependent oligopeptide transporter
VVFIWGTPLLQGRGEPRDPAALKATVFGIPFEWVLYVAGVGAVAICWQMVQNQALVGQLLGIAGAALVLYVVAVAVMKLEAVERNRIFAALFLITGSILFWALFEQAGSSLNLLTDRMVDRDMLGTEVPASVFQSINAIYIVLFDPVFAGMWTMLGRRGLEPSAPMKFGLSLIQLGGGFLVLVLGAQSVEAGELIPVIFIFLIYLLHTTGELCLSPVGLSMVTKLSPKRIVSTVMGAWFLATAFSNYLAGMIAALTGVSHGESGSDAIPPPQETVHVYGDVFGTIAIAACASALVVFLLTPLLRRWMHEELPFDD